MSTRFIIKHFPIFFLFVRIKSPLTRKKLENLCKNLSILGEMKEGSGATIISVGAGNC